MAEGGAPLSSHTLGNPGRRGACPPAGPTISVMLPGGKPPCSARSSSGRPVGRWPAESPCSRSMAPAWRGGCVDWWVRARDGVEGAGMAGRADAPVTAPSLGVHEGVPSPHRGQGRGCEPGHLLLQTLDHVVGQVQGLHQVQGRACVEVVGRVDARGAEAGLKLSQEPGPRQQAPSLHEMGREASRDIRWVNHCRSRATAEPLSACKHTMSVDGCSTQRAPEMLPTLPMECRPSLVEDMSQEHTLKHYLANTPGSLPRFCPAAPPVSMCFVKSVGTPPAPGR